MDHGSRDRNRDNVTIIIQTQYEILDEVTLDDSNNWTVTWSDLEKFDEEGNPYYYRVQGIKILDEFIFGASREEHSAQGSYSLSCTDSFYPDYGPAAGNCDFNKTLYGLLETFADPIVITKIWENVPQGKELPSIEIGVQNKIGEEWVDRPDLASTLDGSEPTPWTKIREFVASEEGYYKFTEINVLEDYEVSIENEGIVQSRCFSVRILSRGDTIRCFTIVEITNTYIGPEDPIDPVSITATKNWANLPEGKEVSGVEVALLRNGEEIDTAILNDTNNWTYTWDDLDPVDENNQPYEYTVEERNVSEDFDVSYETETYCAVLQNNEEDCNDIKVEITNTYIDPEKPVDPKEPEKPINPEKPQEPELPNIGISQDISYLSGLMMIASGLLLVLVTKKRRLENKL